MFDASQTFQKQTAFRDDLYSLLESEEAQTHWKPGWKATDKWRWLQNKKDNWSKVNLDCDISPKPAPFTALTKAAKRHLTPFCRYANHVLTLCCDQNKLVTCLLLILLHKGFSSGLKHIQEGENFHQLDNKVVFNKSERLLSSPDRLLRQSTTHNIGGGTADWKASYCLWPEEQWRWNEKYAWKYSFLDITPVAGLNQNISVTARKKTGQDLKWTRMVGNLHHQPRWGTFILAH